MDLSYKKDSIQSLAKLSNSDDFYYNVFKKTERIVSVLFYILSHTPSQETTKRHHDYMSDTAMSLHASALAALEIYQFEAGSRLAPLLHDLVALESVVRVAVGARALTEEAALLLLSELDAVERYLKHHFVAEAEEKQLAVSTQKRRLEHIEAAAGDTPPTTPRVRRERRVIPQNDLSSDALRVQQALPDRATRILTVLSASGEASIKDISEVIRDCSEKTIQRELNSLIEEGKVVREGERRWSRYRAVEPVS